MLAGLGLAACGGGRGAGPQGVASGTPRAGPVALTPAPDRPSSALMPLDETAVRRAIANYTVNKERERSSYRLAGADLNGDGRAEALVLFEGKDWCAATGCSLAIFSAGDRGYRVAFRIVRVKAPVVVAEASSNGWRHLVVTTGGGPAPVRRVLLRFGDQGYPRNALLEPELPGRAEVTGEVAIAAGPASAASGSQAAGAR